MNEKSLDAKIQRIEKLTKKLQDEKASLIVLRDSVTALKDKMAKVSEVHNVKAAELNARESMIAAKELSVLKREKEVEVRENVHELARQQHMELTAEHKKNLDESTMQSRKLLAEKLDEFRGHMKEMDRKEAFLNARQLEINTQLEGIRAEMCVLHEKQRKLIEDAEALDKRKQEFAKFEYDVRQKDSSLDDERVFISAKKKHLMIWESLLNDRENKLNAILKHEDTQKALEKIRELLGFKN